MNIIPTQQINIKNANISSNVNNNLIKQGYNPSIQ
jgi:hypothetical protein